MSVSMRTIATFAVAIFLGVVAVLLTRGYVSSVTQRAEPAASSAVVPVVVASQQIERGVVLTPAALKVVNFPAEAAPANVFHAISDLTGNKDQQRLALRSLVSNEPVLASYVSGPGGKLNLSGTIAAGMRAVTFRSTDVTGVGGFVLPGDRVDVLLTRAGSINGGSGGGEILTQVLAENIRVLGVDQSANDEADKPVVSRAITLEMTPEQATALSLGQAVGTIALTLRHVADDTPLVKKAMDVRDLSPAPRRPTGGPAAPAIRVIRGTDSSRFSFGAGGGTAAVSDAATGFANNTAAGLRGMAASAPAGVKAGVTTP